MAAVEHITAVYHSFVEFEDNLSESGLLVADIDGDGCNELALATITGRVTLFNICKCPKHDKYTRTVIKGLGTVTCFLFGDVLGEESDQLLAITAEGKCHVFKDACTKPTPTFSFRIPTNAASAVIIDSGLFIGFQNGSLLHYSVEGNNLIQNPNLIVFNSRPSSLYVLESQMILVNTGYESFVVNTVYHSTTTLDLPSDSICNSLVWKTRTRTYLAYYSASGNVRIVDSESLLVVFETNLESSLMYGDCCPILGVDDDLLLTTWNGVTFVIEDGWRVLRYDFGQPVLAFASTLMNIGSVETPKSQPCLVYVTLKHQVIVVHDIRVPDLVRRRCPVEAVVPI